MHPGTPVAKEGVGGPNPSSPRGGREAQGCEALEAAPEISDRQGSGLVLGQRWGRRCRLEAPHFRKGALPATSGLGSRSSSSSTAAQPPQLPTAMVHGRQGGQANNDPHLRVQSRAGAWPAQPKGGAADGAAGQGL